MPKSLVDDVKKILESNARWAAGELQKDSECFRKLDEEHQHQEPHTLWIGCADSRVSETTVVPDAQPGDIFVHRNIANQLHLDDTNALSVLQYGVDALHIHRVIVVGHTRCGGVEGALKAAQERNRAPTGKPALGLWLEPFTKTVEGLLPELEGLTQAQAVRRLVDVNVKEQVAHLSRTQTIRHAWERYAAGEEVAAVWIHGFVYDIDTGLLIDLHVSQGPPGAVGPQ